MAECKGAMINMGNIEQLILNIIMFLFSKHRRLVFTAFNQSEYYEAVNKLKSHGVSYRSRITSHDTGTVGSNRNDNSQYDIYVKKDEEYLAGMAINSRS
jgi:hypothetical protein